MKGSRLLKLGFGILLTLIRTTGIGAFLEFVAFSPTNPPQPVLERIAQNLGAILPMLAFPAGVALILQDRRR